MPGPWQDITVCKTRSYGPFPVDNHVRLFTRYSEISHISFRMIRMLQRVLILESPHRDLQSLQRAFASEAGRSCDVDVVPSLDELTTRLADDPSQSLVVVHNESVEPAGRVLGSISRIHEIDKHIPVVVTSDQGDVDSAARAIEAGAVDFLVQGRRLEDRISTLLGKLRGLFDVVNRNRLLDEQNASLREAIQAKSQLVGESPQVKSLIDQIRRVAALPRPLLIVGERGTGKELVAHAIHLSAGDSSRPMIAVNCAAFSDALLESELFGHEKGAFTGAEGLRRGKFELADSGTLFLDEIANMSPAFQQKILRVVEYGTFARVGGTQELKTSARIIGATNCDLEKKIEDGEFIRDLYDRLAFEVIAVPPLRERSGDIELLAHHILHQFAREIPTFKGKSLTRAAISALNRYAFPGNVRELKSIIERAACRATTDEITPEDIGMLRTDEAATTGGTFQDKVTAFSKSLIADAMRQSTGNQAQAARLLGLSYHQFRYYYKKYSGHSSNDTL